MANLRQLSTVSHSLILFAAITFSFSCRAEPEELNNPEKLDTPAPSAKVFFERDLWQQDTDKIWVFTHLLLSAVRSPSEAKFERLQVSNDTKQSLKDIRSAFANPNTRFDVQTSSFADLVYAYSWSNAGFMSYLFSGLHAVKNRVADVDSYVGDKVEFYGNNRGALLATAVTIGGTGGGAYALKKVCAPPAADPAQGSFFVRHIKDTATNTANAARYIWGAITAHPYIAIGVAASYTGYELCLSASNMYYDVPVSLMYYTDRIINGDGTAQAATWTNTFYGFSGQKAKDHYRGYIDMNLYNSMLYEFLLYGRRIYQLQFGAIPAHPQELLALTNSATNLPEMVYTPYLPDYFDHLGRDYSGGREEHRTAVKTAVDKAVSFSSPDIACGKFMLFNHAEVNDDSPPLYLFSLCSIGEVFAYAKLPHLPYARIKKTEVAGFVQDLMEYTGSTRLVILSAKKS